MKNFILVLTAMLLFASFSDGQCGSGASGRSGKGPGPIRRLLARIFQGPQSQSTTMMTTTTESIQVVPQTTVPAPVQFIQVVPTRNCVNGQCTVTSIAVPSIAVPSIAVPSMAVPSMAVPSMAVPSVTQAASDLVAAIKNDLNKPFHLFASK